MIRNVDKVVHTSTCRNGNLVKFGQTCNMILPNKVVTFIVQLRNLRHRNIF